MKKHYKSRLLVSICCISLTLFNTIANASDLVTTPSDSSSNIDYVLSELTRQYDNASILVKSTRQPVSLALDSPLINAEEHINTDTLVANGQSEEDVLRRLTAVASTSVNRFTQTGQASWYGEKFHGQTTASGERFNMNAMTAAHPTLPFNSYLKVTNESNGESVIVKVNDRGPFGSDRVVDLSYGAANQIGLADSGVGNVTIERIEAPE